MRAPGESIGTFALESAIDELAYELQDGSDRTSENQRARKRPDERHANFRAVNLRSLPARRGEIRLEQAQSRTALAARRQMAGRPGRRDGVLSVLPFSRERRGLRISADGTALCRRPRPRWAWERRPRRFSMPPIVSACRSTRFRFTMAIPALPDTPMAGGSNQTADHLRGGAGGG